MTKIKKAKEFVIENWLLLLIVAQPVLDVIAFWNQNSVATIAGYIRLLVMLALPLTLLIKLKNKKGFIISMALIGLYCALHVLNCLRLGYISMFTDISYLAKIAQMPILAICFTFCIRDERMKKQAISGIWCAGILMLAFLVLALLTGTWNSTYGGGVGISGWVIDGNRCANSILFVTMACFAVFFAARSEKKSVQILLPSLVALILFANGTKACYLGLFIILAGFAAFELLHRAVTGERVKKAFVISLVLLIALAAAAYPISPRAEIDSLQAIQASEKHATLHVKLGESGRDISKMSLEEKLADPVVVELYGEYYQDIVGYVFPPMFERFETKQVLAKYKMVTDFRILIDVRLMKTNYASLIWDECDTLTKLVGFEITQVVGDDNGRYDMENDFPAIFYYTGYIGFAMYILFILYFVFLVIKRLVQDFKNSFSYDNFTLLLCLVLQLGLAQFSGAILRRPNVSIYMSIVLALIYYKTAIVPVAWKKGIE